MNIKKEVFIGFIIGILGNISGTYLYIYLFSDYSLEETIIKAQKQDILGSLIALGAIMNLFIFFIFLKKKQYYRARGVVLAVVIASLLIMILKFY
ncbi:MAG: hypothetical protein ACWA45_00175 [Flavobacteriales bacterium]